MAGDDYGNFTMWTLDSQAALISLLAEHTKAGRLQDGKGSRNVWVEVAHVLSERFPHAYTTCKAYRGRLRFRVTGFSAYAALHRVFL
ncbi:hypothetical protein CJ030_MR1G015728 [Morella rubra]|uniref:Myb/SANT-like domain-containing protein n=1 Tax=Morella rubra TaxID=262757 RepID=A0A6A1WPC7_9ROSI|nr:hypothetical protein CJ030_MR1G015728 [Morella rubra]